MSRIVVRPAGPEQRPRRISLGSTVLSLAVGGGLAYLLHEVWKAAHHEPWHPGQPLPRTSSSREITAARRALSADAHLSEAALTLLPGGRGTIELHGWVADRRERARAARIVAEAISPVDLINSVMVHGEDDELEFEEPTVDLAAG